MRPTTTAARLDRTRPVEGGNWLTAKAAAPESVRERIGRQVASTLEGAEGTGIRVADPLRLLTPEQLFLVYLRCPDVRASIDGIARRVSTWAFCVETTLKSDDPGYEEAAALAEEIREFLGAPNQDGETWQELTFKLVLDLLTHEQGAWEAVFDKLVEVSITPLASERKTTMRIPAKNAALEEIVALHGASIVPIRDATGHLLGYQQDIYGTLGALSYGGVTGYATSDLPWFSRDQLILFRLFPNTSERTAPLIETIIVEVITLMRASDHALQAVDADEIPPGIVVLTGVAGKAAEAAKADLQRLKGKDHKLRVITNPNPTAIGANWVELRRTPKELSLIDVIREIRRTVWRVFGVTPIEMGANDSAPRATAEVQLDVASSHLIEPILDAIEGKVNARIIPLLAGKWTGKIKMYFDRESKLSPAEQESKATALGGLVREGILSRNEARAQIDQEPEEGGDVLTITTTNGLIRVAELGGGEPITPIGGPEKPPPSGGQPESPPGDAPAGVAAEAARPHLRLVRSADHPAWPSAGLFRGHRTLPLIPLGEAIGEYTRTVVPYYREAADEVLAAVGASGATIEDSDAHRILSATDSSLSRLQTRWSLGTAPLYQRAGHLARDSATEHTGAPVVEDWEARSRAYGERAIGYLTAPGGLISDLRTEIARIVGHAADAGANRAADDVSPGLATAAVLRAIEALFSGNEHRTENWSGKLVELANEIFSDGMAEGNSGATSAEEWQVEWVAVGDRGMCPDCSTEGARGFRPASQLSRYPGQTQCNARCRCVLVWWRQSEVDSGEAELLSGNAPGNKPI